MAKLKFVCPKCGKDAKKNEQASNKNFTVFETTCRDCKVPTEPKFV